MYYATVRQTLCLDPLLSRGFIFIASSHLKVVAYNNALSRSIFLCSDGVLVDSTPPVLGNVRADGVRIQPGLIKAIVNSVTQVWLLTADGVKHHVADTTCASTALTIVSPDAFPDESYQPLFSEFTPVSSPHQSTHSFQITHGFSMLRSNGSTMVDTTSACSK